MQLILKYVAENPDMEPPHIILNGSSIVFMQMGRAKFVDSLNYFNMKLKQMPDAFGLTISDNEDMRKGDFCHLFNHPENQNYVGPIPPIEMYCIATMTQKDLEKFFMPWYESKKNDPNYV